MLRSKLLVVSACGVFLASGTAAHAGDDPTLANCMVAGNGYCGGTANTYPRPASWGQRFVVVRQGNQARHVRMYFGVPHLGPRGPFLERAFVGRILTRCAPRGANVFATHNGVAFVRMCGRVYAHRFRP